MSGYSIMNNSYVVSFLLFSFFYHPAVQAFEKNTAARPPFQSVAPARTFSTSVLNAVGALKVFPFADPKKDISCTATHLGQGVMLTAGHCFLGAFSCNNAVVHFYVGQQSHEEWISKCEEILSISADDSRYLGEHQDYALFRVSNPPPDSAVVDLESRVQPQMRLLALSFPRPNSRAAAKRIVTGPCSAISRTVLDYFGHARSEFTFFNDCAFPPDSNGAPLFEISTQKVVGIHQGLFAIPERRIEQSQEPLFRNPAKHTAQSHLTQMLSFAFQSNFIPSRKQILQKYISVGNFAPEAFPSALPGDLKLQVATLEATDGADTVSFEMRNGPETEVHIYDGNFKHFVVRGITATQNDVRLRYKQPVKIEARSSSNAHTLSVLVEKIESP